MERGTNLIREQNLKTVRRLMNRRVRATKAELSRESGLSVVALQSLLQAMEERGNTPGRNVPAGPRASRCGLPL